MFFKFQEETQHCAVGEKPDVISQYEESTTHPVHGDGADGEKPDDVSQYRERTVHGLRNTVKWVSLYWKSKLLDKVLLLMFLIAVM